MQVANAFSTAHTKMYPQVSFHILFLPQLVYDELKHSNYVIATASDGACGGQPYWCKIIPN